MSEYRYILEPYKGMNTRYRCPGCQQKDKTFSLYIDRETGEALSPSVGRCNRESKCGYHYTPKQYFQDNRHYLQIPTKSYTLQNATKSYTSKKVIKDYPLLQPEKPFSFIPFDTFKASLKGHETNHFATYLIKLFGVEVASQLVSRYFIGTSKHWNGATVFWQIDGKGKVRTGKIMLYNPETGKRVKEPFNHISWVHKAIKQPEFALQQCLFGEHLLQDGTKPVGIVESEKTAVIASRYLPQFIWLAVGSLSNLTESKCKALQGRTVTLFPDGNGFEKWKAKAKELSHIATFTVSDLLERKATEGERKQGLDLADYLIRFDYREFALPEPEPAKPEPPATVQPVIERKRIEPALPAYPFTKPEQPKGESWEPEIAELDAYLAGIALPQQLVKPNGYSTITNVALFIESHFATVRSCLRF